MMQLSLLPVVAGGLIAIIAGLVGPYYIQRAKDAAEKKRKRAEKFEELVAAVYDHAHRIDEMRFFIISGQGSAGPTLSSTTKIQAIVRNGGDPRCVPRMHMALYERWVAES
jgi:hypothetical protein